MIQPPAHPAHHDSSVSGSEPAPVAADLPLTDPLALEALVELLGDHVLARATATAFDHWSDLAAASPGTLAWKVGPWASSLRIPATVPPRHWPGADVDRVSFTDPAYPAPLADLEDRPVVVYVRGRYPTVPLVAVGGCHYPSAAGRAAALTAARAAAGAGLAVVASVDCELGRAALSEALRGDGPAPLAVVAGDLARQTLARDLVDRVVAAGGAALSEWGPGSYWEETNVYAAERLVAAAATGVVLAELGVHARGGSALARASMTLSRRILVPAVADGAVAHLGSEALASPNSFSDALFGGNAHVTHRVRAGGVAADAAPEDLAALEAAVAALAP